MSRRFCYTISVEVDKKQLIKVLAICILGTLLFGTVGCALVFEWTGPVPDNEKIMSGVIAGFLMLLCIGTAVLFSYMFYSKHIRPEKYPDEPKPDYEADREAEVHRRLPGKDMFDVIRRYRRRNYMNRVAAIVVCCILLTAAIAIKMSGEYHIDIRISMAVGIGVIVLTFAIAGRKEFSYSDELDFKKAIEKNGIDLVRLNIDFMMGSHFYLRDGLIVLGRDYMVVFAKSLCEIYEVDKMKKLEEEIISQSLQGSKFVLHKLKVFMSDGRSFWFTLRDEKETDLLIKELRFLNVPLEKIINTDKK